MPLPCEECGKNMSESAVVCPHCGQRQGDRDVVDPELAGPSRPRAGVSISSEEAAALFDVKGISAGTYGHGRPRGLPALLLPRDEAVGARRALEWILTALSLPLLLGGFLLIMLRPRLRRHVLGGGEVGLSLLAALFGALAIFSLGSLADWSDALTWGLIALASVALAGRLALRRMRPG